MRHLCSRNKIIFVLIIFIVNFAYSFNVAFYYGKQVPREILKVYDWIVIDPFALKDKFLERYKNKLFIYISIGEFEEYRNLNYKKDWILGINENWNTKIADITNKEYQKFLEHRIREFYKKGYKNYFFDTLESYKLVIPQSKWQDYAKHTAKFIVKIKTKYPDIKIILNRGFDLIDFVKGYIYAVVSESLFYGYDGKSYIKTKNEGTKWLLSKLNYIKSKNIPVIVLDYLPPKERKKAVNLARKIKKLGFIPYITDKDLSTIGISDIEIIRRKILVVYFSKNDIMESSAHRLLQMPLEYMGYIADIKTPEEALKIKTTIDKYAGIVFWLEKDVIDNYTGLFKWVIDRINNKNKILFIDSFGFPLKNEFLNKLGIYIEKNKSSFFEPMKISFKHSSIGFETSPDLHQPNEIVFSKDSEPLLILVNSKNQEFHPIAITKWGGYILGGYAVKSFLEVDKWIVNPFYILKKSLNLQDFPNPDPTTENGMRVFISHIDGDGSVSLSEIYPGKLASEVIRDEILKKYNLPIGVSFVEGEIMPYGAYPEYSKRAIEVAKSIYALKNVETASHTFSHPFKWLKIEKFTGRRVDKKGYNLQIKGYDRFSLFREIVGSCKNLSKLAPDKKQVKVIYWSGNCSPSENALKIAYENNILNINGGDTTITKEMPFLSLIAPFGLKRGNYYQIYTGQQNENVYTYEFTRDYWRFKKVIETFELTDKPRRFKIIDIYYHFYSGTKLASLNALKEVYNWSLKQDIIPLNVSQYILKALDFYETVVAKIQNKWIIKTNKQIRTIKIPKSLGYPDLNESKGVLGYFDYNDQRYIHLDGSGSYILKLTDKKPYKPYLYQSNARLDSIKGNTYSFKSNIVLPKFIFKNFDNCILISNDEFLKEGNIYKFKKEDVRFKIECK